MTVLPVRCTSAAGMPSSSRAARACGGGREVNRGQPGGQHPVHLLRERLVAVAGAEPGLDVPGGDSLEVGREGGREAGHGVALHQQRRRAGSRRSSGGSRSSTRAATSAGDWPGDHQVEIVIGLEPEDIEHLVEHGAVLGGHADDAFEPIGRALQRLRPPAPS